MRRYGEAPRADQTYTRRPGVYAILPRDGQLLMTFQAEPEPEVQLPGGGIDPGESAVQALHREVWEETGWGIAAPRRLGVYKRFVFMPDYDIFAEKICHIYIARPLVHRSDPMEPQHIALWLTPEEALETMTNPGDRDMLSRALRQIA